MAFRVCLILVMMHPERDGTYGTEPPRPFLGPVAQVRDPYDAELFGFKQRTCEHGRVCRQQTFFLSSSLWYRQVIVI